MMYRFLWNTKTVTDHKLFWKRGILKRVNSSLSPLLVISRKKITSLKSRAIYDNIMDTFDLESLAFLRDSCIPIMVSQKLYSAT